MAITKYDYRRKTEWYYEISFIIDYFRLFNNQKYKNNTQRCLTRPVRVPERFRGGCSFGVTVLAALQLFRSGLTTM